MATTNYYPATNDKRAAWWQNIVTNQRAFANQGFTSAQTAAIVADANWGVYIYGTIRLAYQNLLSHVVSYAGDIATGPNGAPAPNPPAVMAWPTAPTPAVLQGIEARREMWVATLKNNANYNSVVGSLLGVEGSVVPFDPTTYQAELFALESTQAMTLAGKFRKANGMIDGINLYGRRQDVMEWKFLGRFNATPFSTPVPMGAAVNPEVWFFQAMAVIKDTEIGLMSVMLEQIVRGGSGLPSAPAATAQTPKQGAERKAPVAANGGGHEGNGHPSKRLEPV